MTRLRPSGGQGAEIVDLAAARAARQAASPFDLPIFAPTMPWQGPSLPRVGAAVRLIEDADQIGVVTGRMRDARGRTRLVVSRPCRPSIAARWPEDFVGAGDPPPCDTEPEGGES